MKNREFVDCDESFRFSESALYTMKWCDYFTENQDYIFVLPLADDEDVGNKYDFDDHKRLDSFLQRDFISNPIHKFNLSENAMITLKKLGINIFDEEDVNF